MSTGFQTIIFSREGGVATITLNRPEVLNAMSPQLLDELDEAVAHAAEDDEVKAVIVTGAGRGFCSGGDVKGDVAAISEMGSFEFRRYAHNRITRKIWEMEKPVIAAVNGVAAGGGAELALMCDIRFASENARFSWLFVKRGLIPDLGGAYALPRLVGASKAKLLMFTGDIINAQEAYRIGLVDNLLPHDQLMPMVNQYAARLAQGPAKAIAMTKVAINKSLTMDLPLSLDYTTNLQYLLAQTEDHKEGFKSFLEKRPPVYKGR